MSQDDVSTESSLMDESAQLSGDKAEADKKALVDALAQSGFVVMEALTRIGAAYDLSLTQMRVLGILRDRRVRIVELAEYLGLEKSTVSGLVDRAVQRGLLERRKNADDGRAVEVSMTTTGVEHAERVYTEISHTLASVTSRLTAQERQTLIQLLTRMLADA